MSANYYELLKYAQTGIASPDMTYYDKMRASMLMGGGTVQTLTGIPPLSFKSNGTPLISWSMLGNGSQSGTPTPDNPVMPTFCGVRTGNLCDQGTISTTQPNINSGVNAEIVKAFKSLTAGETYTLSWDFQSSSTAGLRNVFRLYNGPTYMGVQINNGESFTLTETQINDLTAFVIYFGNAGGTMTDFMLNSGSTALPYEPYGWKIPFENHGENLFDMTTVEDGKNISLDGLITNYSKRCSTVTPIDVSTYSNVTLAFTATLSRTRVIYALFNDSTLVTRQTTVFSGSTIDVSSGNKLYICFYDPADTETVQKSDLSNVMFNLGSSPKPYSPYLNETLPVYLGEVPTVRRIVKEEILSDSIVGYEDRTDFVVVKTRIVDLKTAGNKLNYLCSHFKVKGPGVSFTEGVLNNSYNNYYNMEFGLPTTITSLDDAKAWFNSQKAAGTPVTIWYVSTESQTGILNEPLAKIGDFADELHSTDAAVTIPTVKGDNMLTVETDLQPSEMTITFKG